MGRQKGIITLEGKVGNVSFYKTRDGYAARTSEGINGSRIKNDAAYQRTRENGLEFGRAGKASKLLRDALRPHLARVADGRVAARLTTKILQVIKTDSVNDRGARTPRNGELDLLNDFQFNGNAPLEQSILVPFQIAVNRVTGIIDVQAQPFVPANLINAPQGATHFKLIFGAAAIRFEESDSNSYFKEDIARPIDMNLSDPIGYALNVPPNFEAGNPIFVMIGIEFLQVVNTKEYPLKSAARNAMAIVNVNLA